MTTIATDKPRGYTGFLSETIEQLGKFGIEGIAISAICEDGNVITGYWNMSLQDKAIVHTNIQYDCIDQFIKANRDKYFEDQEENNNAN